MLDPADLHPPPDVVEKLEDRVDGLRELLVEPPLVLGVLTPEAPGDCLDHLPDGIG
jgi:hypothetical protein